MTRVSKFIKASFIGEWMWVEVLRRVSEKEIIGRLDNHPVVDLNRIKRKLKCGDTVRLILIEDPQGSWWEFYEKASVFEVFQGGKK